MPKPTDFYHQGLIASIWQNPYGKPEPEPAKPHGRFSKGGKKSAETKRKRAAEIQDRALKLAIEIRAKKPPISQLRLADEIRGSVGCNPDRMVKIIRQWEKSGELAKRTRTSSSTNQDK
jgi:hypothetical protein